MRPSFKPGSYLLAMVAVFVMCACNSTSNAFNATTLQGTYTLYANGYTAGYDPTSLVASVTLDGKGNVSGCEQDLFATDPATVVQSEAVTGGSISIGVDGRGTLTLQFPNPAPPENFSIVQVSQNHLLVTEFDAAATTSGSIDKQTAPTSEPTGGNAFTALDRADYMSFGGVVSISNGNVTGGSGDDDYQGGVDSDFSMAGTVTSPDQYGRGTISLYDKFANANLQFAYYVVGPEVFRLIEIDGATNNGFFLAGSMYGQGTAAGAFSAGSLNGHYAFMATGTPPGANPLFWYGAAGQFIADGSSGFASGSVMDINDGYHAPVLAADISSGTSYSISSNGHGTLTFGTALGYMQHFAIYMIDPSINIVDPNSNSGTGGALLNNLDTASLGIGFAVPQTSGATFSGNYAFSERGAYLNAGSNPAAFGLAGVVTSDGSSKLTGTVDVNDPSNSGLIPSATVTGTWSADSNNPGRLTPQVSVSGFPPPNQMTFYQANSNLAFGVDTDWIVGTPGNGTTAAAVLEKQQ